MSGQYDINLFAVWAQNDKEDRHNRYIGQVWLALQEYKSKLQEDIVIVGDFNSNTIWDKDYSTAVSLSQMVAFLENKCITSLYHWLRQEKQGEETTKTLAFRKDVTNGYHIDYFFLSQSMIIKNINIKILGFQDWVAISDHVPMIIDL